MKKHILSYLIVISLLISFNIGKASEIQEGNFISNVRQLIYEGKRSGEGYFSQDGKKLIFQSERIDDNPFYQIFMLNFETGDINQVSNGTGKTTCAYFQWNGTRVLYSSSYLDPKAKQKQKDELDFRASGKKKRYSWDYEPEMDIFSADQDGKNIKRLTSEFGYDAEGSFSPDGKTIVFSSNRSAYAKNMTDKDKKQLELDASYFCELYTMNADGSNVRQLTNTPGYDGGPFFSQDGTKIIWRRFSPDGHSADIYTMNADGTNEKKITDFGAMSWAPFFDPTGEYIVFASNKFGFGNFEVFLVDKNGEKEPVRVTNTDGFDGLPVISPDGKKLCWTSGRSKDASNQLFIADWSNAGALKALAEAPKRNQTALMNFTSEILTSELKAKVSYFASEELEGRMTGSEGTRLAANYIKTQIEKLGLKPLGETFDYKFDFVQDIVINDSKNSLSFNGQNWKLYDSFIPDLSSNNGEISGNVAFVGYGIKTGTNSEKEYNSYKGLDVKGKIVMMLSGMPDGLKEEEKKSMLHYSDKMFKIMVARELGAVGVVFISNRQYFSKPKAGSIPAKAGLVIGNVNYQIANQILKSMETNVDTLIAQLKDSSPHFSGSFDIKSAKLEMKVDLSKKIGQDNDVLAYIPASKATDDYILIGGHYDHLGKGETSSLSDDEHKNFIHNGADDNASGTSAVLELAEYFANLKKDKPELFTKNVIFGWWSGEELGLVGSEAFCDKPSIDIKKIKAYFNFDMVGMLKENKLSAQGLGSSPGWKKILEKKNIVAGFDLKMQDDPYLPTDAMAFYKKGVPVIAFFTGLHEYYHRYNDDIENLNFEGMGKITKFAANVITEVMKTDSNLAYASVAMSSNQASAKSFGVALGTIPDYTADVEGMKLSGVRTGGAAEKAGIKGGDIIIKLAGKDIKNIYDYTNMLSELKAGEKYKITIIRDKVNMELEIIPALPNH
ncbi:MAG: M28 family peptidase [Candidatus Kapabacteria bacterium]|nr:M28 family peptidase [Candidatus Kapabacteria bacterium]